MSSIGPKILTLSVMPFISAPKPLTLNILNNNKSLIINNKPTKGRKSKWTLDNFKEQAIQIHGNNYDYSMVTADHIKCSNSYIPIRCVMCEYIWEPSIHHHINHKSGCPDCAGKLAWTYERFISRTNSMYGNIYDYSMVTKEHIQGKDCLIPIKCNICGYVWTPSIHCHINGKTGCPDCGGKIPWTLERFLEKAVIIHGDKYDYSMVTHEHIQGKESKIPVRCMICNYIFTPRIHDHIGKKSGCSRCKFSKGEIECANILDNLGINYHIQYITKSLPNKRYDFMFIYQNNSYLFEFDGAQHFEFNKFFHTNMDNFICKQRIDIIKTINAISNGYKIIRISYNEINSIYDHIVSALTNKENLYVSNPQLYKYILDNIK